MRWRRAVELVAWPAVALIAAVGLAWAAVAVLRGIVDPLILKPDADRPVDGLVWFLIWPVYVIPPVVAWIGAVVIGAFTWVVVLLVGVRRVFPERRRGWPATLCVLLATAASAIGVHAVVESADGEPEALAVVAVFVGSMAAAGLVFPLWAALPFVRRAAAEDAVVGGLAAEGAAVEGLAAEGAAVEGAAAVADDGPPGPGSSGGLAVLDSWRQRE